MEEFAIGSDFESENNNEEMVNKQNSMDQKRHTEDMDTVMVTDELENEENHKKQSSIKKKHHHHRHHHHHHRRNREKIEQTEPAVSTSEKVKVIVRCRPISEKESLQGHSRIVQISADKKEIEVHRPNPASTNIIHAKVDKVFTFDSVYDERTTQGQLYEEAFRDLIDSVLNGFNGTIFAYGQTGTGKTYTMEGIREISEEQGVIPNAFRHIFDRINESPELTYLVRASYLEIYQEEIKDLLNSKLKICELKENSDGVYVKGLSNFLCRDFDEINKLMSKGNKNRSTGATNMNEHSSRSHAIFMIAVEMSEKWADGETHVKVGRLNLVDLAGSERQGKTGAEGDRLKEAVKINLSLSALGNVIGALADGKHGHIPYRDSKLTRLLQDSLGGNSRTIMVATIGPASFNYDETMVTLRYASRAKKIKNKPKINEDPKDAMLRNYQEEITKLRALLSAKLNQQKDVSFDDDDSGRQRRRRTNGIEGNGLFDNALLKELAPYLESYGLHIQKDPKEILKILEDKRKALLSDTETVKEEKERLIRKLESTHKKVQQAEDECMKLHDRIEWLESKVLNGGKTLLDHTNEQQKLIEERQKELDEEKLKEGEIRQKIAEHDLSVVELKEIQTTIESHIQSDGKRLKKIQSKVVKARSGTEERMQKHVLDISRLQRYLQHIQKDDEMNKAILENFVPNKTKYLLESLAQHNSDDSFSFLPITSITLPRPLVNRMTMLPLYTKTIDGTVHPTDDIHYVDENILQIQPIPPFRVAKRYVPPDTDPHIRSVMQRALSEAEKDVIIDCNKVNQPKRRATTARVRMGEVITFQNDMNVRQILSAKHRSKEIPYKDFVAVTRMSSTTERERSAIPFKNQIKRTNHVSLSPDLLLFPTPPSFPYRRPGSVPYPKDDCYKDNSLTFLPVIWHMQ